MLSHDDARRFYDRFGSRQDSQAFYEDAAVNDLIQHSQFESAQTIGEFGCGTGRLAERLLREILPAEAHYFGFDLSQTMVGLAGKRLAPFGARADVRLTDGSPTVSLADRSVDRFLLTYVLDLLTTSDASEILVEAHRVLNDGGKLCLASITPGPHGCSRFVSRLWERVFRWRPVLVGGCHPIALTPLLHSDKWLIEYRNVVVAYGIASEVIVAVPVGPTKA